MKRLQWPRLLMISAIVLMTGSAFLSRAGNTIDPSAGVPRVAQQPQADGAAQQKLVGTWQGVLDVGAAKLRLVLKVGKQPDGTLKALLDSPDQGATDMSLDSIARSGTSVNFQMTSPAAANYEGDLSADGSEISGHWIQGGQRFPLNFKRSIKTESSDPNAPKPEGPKLEKIDAGGHKLNLLMAGSGGPTVILEGGFGTGIASWTTVHGEIAKFTRVVAYDRAGLGQSEPGPKPRTAMQFARELHTALQNAGIKPPYVLVGHSMGGITVRVFADMYPQEVAGLVLVDPSQEAFNDWLKTHPSSVMKEAEAQIKDAPEGIRAEAEGVDASYEQARKAKVPAKIPVIVLSATRTPAGVEAAASAVWLVQHKEWVKKVPGAKLVPAEKSGHMIQLEQPDLVIEAVREEVNQANSKKP
jgi:pimeloyl-ACP methyl ester carboxylesterase